MFSNDTFEGSKDYPPGKPVWEERQYRILGSFRGEN